MRQKFYFEIEGKTISSRLKCYLSFFSGEIVNKILTKYDGLDKGGLCKLKLWLIGDYIEIGNLKSLFCSFVNIDFPF